MTVDNEDSPPGNHPDPQFRQTAVSHVQARDIQIGQIVQKIVYLGIPPHSPLRPFALVISIALYLMLLITGFVLLWRDGAEFVPLLLLILGSGFLSLTCFYYAWFWKPELQDRSPPIAAGSATEEQVKKQRTKQRSRQQIRRLAIVGFFLIPLLTCGGFLGWRSLPPPKVLVLVANFDGVEQQNYQVTENILRNLRNATESYADVKVQALNQTITEQQGSEVARVEGERKKAAIVIWGDYGATPDHVQISTHFEVLKPPAHFPKLEKAVSGEAQTLAIAELNSFKLQTRLSEEMSYLTLFTLGMVQYAKEDWNGAIARFSDALAQVKTTPLALGQAIVLFYCGNSSVYQEDYKSAIADYDRAIQLKPDYAKAYYNRGLAYDHQGKYSKAIADYNRAIQLKPDYAEAYNNRGLAYDHQGKSNEAIADYDRAIQLKPDYAKTQKNWRNADDHQYFPFADLKPPEAPKSDEAKAAEAAEAYYNRGFAYTMDGEYTQAIADYTQVIQLKPDYAEAYNNRGVVYANQQNYTQAIADYTQAIQLKLGDAEAYYNRGKAYTNQQNYTQAIADYNHALKIEPDDAEAYYNRGVVYDNQQNYAQAIADYTQALKLKPDFAEAYYNRGVVYDNQQNYTQAIADYTQALKLQPDNTYAYYNKARIYSLENKIKEAIESLQQAINLDARAREAAKTDSDFNNIRKDQQFQALVGQ